jgi:hypothetical protein
MNLVDRLNVSLKQQLRHPWSGDRSGGERVWFLVFDPADVRKVLKSREEFRQSAEAAGKQWTEIDISAEFGAWMSSHRYAQAYFKRPQLAQSKSDDFAVYLADRLREHLQMGDADTLHVLLGAETLYGITRLSHIVRQIEDAIPGRLMVFFPGTYVEPQYRLLNARDGWNYLAVPILPSSGRSA